LKEVQMLQ